MIKIFAHRGYVINDFAQNSIESLKAAFDNGFSGIEYDVWFLNGELIIAHDKPESGFASLSKFKDFFLFGNKIKYWIDFKNLDETNADQVLALVKKEILIAKIDLKNIYFAPFIEKLNDAISVYAKIRDFFGQGAQIVALCVEIPGESATRYYQDLKKNDVKFLSIMHKNIDQNFMKVFHDVEIFAWTVNDLQRIAELEKLGVKNCASDKITPKNYEQRK